MEIGQKTLVYSEIERHLTTDSVFQTLLFPEVVKLSSAVTSSMSGEIMPVEGGGWYNYTFDLTETGLTVRTEDDLGFGSVEYSSSDGITYTRTSYSYDNMGMGESVPYGTIKFMKPSKFSVLPTPLSEFFTEKVTNFDGLYYLDELRDGSRMITYTGEEYKLPYDIMNDIDIYSQWSKDSAIGLFMFDKVTKDLEIYEHNKFMIKDGALYSISPGGATAVGYLKYTYSTGEVYSEMNVPVSQTGEKIHDNFSDLVIGCIDDYNGVTFLDGNQNTIGTYTNGNEYTFPFKKKVFRHSKVGLNTPAEYVLSGNKVYTDNGVIEGKLGSYNKLSDVQFAWKNLISGIREFAPVSFKNAFSMDTSTSAYMLHLINTSNCYNFYGMLSGNKATDIDLTRLSTDGASKAVDFVDLEYMFSGCANVVSYKGLKEFLTGIIAKTPSDVQIKLNNLFYGNSECTDVIDYLDTSKVSALTCAFSRSPKMTVDISNWKFNQPVSLQQAFEYGPKVIGFEEADTTNWDGIRFLLRGNENVVNFKFNDKTIAAGYIDTMLSSCPNLETVEIKNLKVTTPVSGGASVGNMYKNSIKLRTIDMSGWINDTTCSMSDMCNGCTSLESIDAKGLAANCTQSYIYMNNMFKGCTKLKFADIRDIPLDKANTTSRYQNAFTDVPADCLIIVKNSTMKSWLTSKFTHLNNVKTVAEYEAS